MPLYQVAVLAIVQGLFEFLPASAWAHLVMVPPVLGWANDYGVQVELAVQAGTLLAVMAYFWREMGRLARGGGLLLRLRVTRDGRLLLLLVLATLPAAAAAFALRDHAATLREHYVLIAAATIGFGLLLYAADAAFLQVRRIEHLGPANALIFGLAQIAALLPGASRAGVTMTAGRFLGFERRQAARFALLMGVPVGIGQVALLARDWLAGRASTGFEGAALLAGALAFLASLAALAFLMAWLKRGGFGIFAIYRAIAGAAMLYWYFALRAA